ncbi:MAG TPA: phosphatase PAP2 family protein [Streptosporangiaceae bacterium]
MITDQIAPSEVGAPSRPPSPAARGRLRWRGLAWPRLPAWLELVTILAGYGAYALVRFGVRASRRTAFLHAAEMWRFERWLHADVEPQLNRLIAAHVTLADAVGYYYGLLHFIITPLVLAWLYLRRPAQFPRLRSALILATTAANVVFWTWPLAPPRLAVPGMNDVLVVHHILGAANPHGVSGLIDLYAAMPSLHVAWATWCAVAIVTTTRGRWRHLAWLYPAATTFVVLASANHFVLDTVGGVAIMGLGLLAAGRLRSADSPDVAPRAVQARAPEPRAITAGAGHRPQSAQVPWLGGFLVLPGLMWWSRPRPHDYGYDRDGRRAHEARRTRLRLPGG